MKPSEAIFLGSLAVFAGATLIGSLGMPFTSGVTFGPGFLPMVMSIAVLAIGAGIALRGLRRTGHDVAANEPAGDVRTVLYSIALIAAAVAGATFGSLLLPLGFCLLITTSLLLGRGWTVGIVSTLITMAAVYAIFGLWLQIPIS